MSNIENLDEILNSFKVKANCISYQKIRNVSLYDLRLAPGTRVKELQKFSSEISLAMKAKATPIVRIKPELGIVRLEIIDEDPYKISFFDEFSKIKKQNGDMPMYFGNSIDGDDIWVDMIKNPHLLIAGCTGSGKSTLLHVLMANALGLSNTKIYLIDSKNVEFKEYETKFDNKVSIADTYDSALNMLNFVHKEMEFRYSLMRDRELSSQFFGTAHPEFPQILFIIDEFADLIMQDVNKQFYTMLCKLAQKCRAAGIFCILATQRPSVDIISGSIKANFPARISCQVASGIDSKVILDSVGAELLAGRGDAIIKNYNHNYQRFQVAHTTPEEVCKFYAEK
jgi:S-DNA-T family DNA segregation ATPase FtsK/SpoIIIE